MRTVFENKTPSEEKLLDFGFTKEGNALCYREEILEGQFCLTVRYSAGKFQTELFDNLSEDVYSLHLVPEASGAFVGSVRGEYERVISKIENACFPRGNYHSRGATDVIEYAQERYDTPAEYLWKSSPDCCIVRRKDNNKWYGAILCVSRAKLGLKSEEKVEILDIRANPEAIDSLVDGEKYFRGYHMNKKSWLTVLLDGSLPKEEIFARLDESYLLAQNKKK